MLSCAYLLFVLIKSCCLWIPMSQPLCHGHLRVGQSVYFSCGGTENLRTNDIYWYQKKETEPFKIILHIDKNDCKTNKGYGHSQKDDFTGEKTQRGCELKISQVKVDHSASYYCSCWSHSFCSTLSHCTKHLLKPVVSVYPAASRDPVERGSSLLCLASAMFPPVVQFSWKRQKNNRQPENLNFDRSERLELRESGYSASILLIHQQEDRSYKYSCSVKHEGGTVEAQTQQGN
uniref:Ig-like domain-containing protein n=1 Tax=Oryzias melastigma TaxID=30732 RepID=A0A3B3B6M8_ORYME